MSLQKLNILTEKMMKGLFVKNPVNVKQNLSGENLILAL